MKNIKKSLLLCVAALSMGGLSGCDFFTKPLDFNGDQQGEKEQEKPQEETKVAVESLTIDASEIELLVGASKKINVTIAPENATNKEVTFSSSKPTVATVSNDGTVAGASEGTSTITIQSVDNPAKFQICSVTVKKSVVDVESVEIGESTVTLLKGATTKLQATVLPDNATDKSLTWTSLNESIVSVDQQGNVSALELGQAMVRVRSNSNKDAEKFFTINVEAEVIGVTGVTISDTARALEENAEPLQLAATVAPINASNKAVSWLSSDPAVASVSSNGLVTPHSDGEAIITVTTADGGFTDTCTITVFRHDVTSFGISESSIAFSSSATGANATKQLSVSIEPDNATYKEVEWSSSDESVATVSSTGLVESKGKVGTAIIAAVHVQSHKMATCLVTVVNAENIEITNLEIDVNKAYKTYLANIEENPSNRDAEFFNREETYEFGNDNELNLRPEFEVYDTSTSTAYSSSAWPFPYSFKVEKETTPGNFDVADPSEYSVLDTVKCDFKFANTDGENGTAGNTYKISIKAGGYDSITDPDIIDDLTAVYIVKVVDGYNVTNEYELSYLDTRTAATTDSPRGKETSIDLNYTVDFPAFKESKGLNKTLQPNGLVFHKDLSISAEHLPSSHFYDEAEAAQNEWTGEEKNKSLGSLKDYAYIYRQTTNRDLVISGNYFTIDFSRIPLVKRTNGLQTTELAKTESHAKLFRAYDGTVEMKNMNIIGNAHVAQGQEETYLAGGLIGFDVLVKCSVLEAKNILGHNCYITFMNDGNWADLGGADNLLKVTDCKLSDNYNCFIYNYGGTVISEHTVFEGCGGPVIIQDHILNDKQYVDGGKYDEIVGGSFQIYGHRSTAEFNNCDIRNYVIGEEAWFYSFAVASEMIEPIKMLSDLLATSTSSQMTYLYDKNLNGVINAVAAAQSEKSVMNLIVVNKSSTAEDATVLPVDGNVKFRDANGVLIDEFNYFNPVSMAANTPEETDRFTAECTTYQIFRGVQAATAPVFETSGGYASSDGSHLLPMETVAGQSPVVTPPAAFENNNGHLGVYYTGMLMVFALGNVGQPA